MFLFTDRDKEELRDKIVKYIRKNPGSGMNYGEKIGINYNTMKRFVANPIKATYVTCQKVENFLNKNKQKQKHTIFLRSEKDKLRSDVTKYMRSSGISLYKCSQEIGIAYGTLDLFVNDSSKEILDGTYSKMDEFLKTIQKD